MKKILYMALIIGGVLSIKAGAAAYLETPTDYAMAVRNPNAPEESAYTWPVSHTMRRFYYPDKDKIPAGYVVDPRNETRYYKQIVDPEHEYYNQFIEGYVPKEHFERDMKYRRFAEKPWRALSREEIDSREKDKEWYIQEREAKRKSGEEKAHPYYQGNIVTTEQEIIQRMERELLDKENMNFVSRAINWLKSLWQDVDNKPTSFGTANGAAAVSVETKE